jgi:spore maturation protein CgeB
VGVLDEYLEQKISSLFGDALHVFWDVDAPATLDRMGANAEDAFRAAVPKFDVIFTYGGGNPVVTRYLSFGAQRCVPIYNALDPDVHHPAPEDPRFAGDLSFLGNRLPDREARVEEFFLRAAALSPQHTFILGGSGWSDKALSPNVRYVGHVYTADHNAFNCSAKAVLNISRESMARYGFSLATRVFEAAGAGACIITDRWEGIDHFLQPGKEVLVADDGREVAALVSQLTTERAREIGAAARRRVLAEHTYTQRGALVHETLHEIFSARAPIGAVSEPVGA